MRQHLGPETGLPDTAIAIVGMSCRFANARGLGAYWDLLRSGVEGIETLSEEELLAAGVERSLLGNPAYVRRAAPLAHMECFDAGLFGLSPRDAAIMDPQHRHFVECAWEALEDAGHAPERFDGSIGVFGGSGHNAYMPYNLMTNRKLVRDVGLFLLRHTGNDKDFLTTRVSYLLNLTGPSVNVQTACSTSLVAVHMAAQSLLNGECDMALAGGSSIELPHRRGYLFEEGEILSPDGRCRPFDAGSQGTVFGSGVAVVALRRLADAVEAGDDIHAVIRGSAINNDGAGKVGYLAPSVDGQAQVIAEALEVADVDAGSVDYVEAHGTGTPVGDPIEVAALTEAFRRSTDAVGYCGLGSVKAAIGHTDTAAGAAGLIKVALAMRHGELPASLNFGAPNPDCAFDDGPFRVQAKARRWRGGPGRPRRAGVSSLGVGGTNAHVILEEAPPRAASGPSRPFQLIVGSARSATALDANAAALADHLRSHDGVNLADAAYTLSTGRTALSKRRAVVAADNEVAAAMLTGGGPDQVITNDALPNRPVDFLFCGAGSQHVDMGRGLYDAEPVFRAAMDECLAHLDGIGGEDVRRWLYPSDEDRARALVEIERPSVALPALLAVQVATARLWMSLGVRPAAMIGHSSGEYAAAHLAGVVGLEDALRIVGARGRLFERVPSGAMLSVPLSEQELAPLLPTGLSIAAINAPKLCVASGPVHAVEELRRLLSAREVESHLVRIPVAAHSAMLDPILPNFRAVLRQVRFGAPSIPFVSNLTGDWIAAADATDPEYWVRHLRNPVRFTDGLGRLLADKDRALLEVGPGRTVTSLARRHPERGKDQPALNSLRHPDQQAGDQAFFLGALGRLWTLGVAIDWNAYWKGERRNRVALPTYRFDRQRHWIEPGAAAVRDDDDAPERRADIADWLFEPIWERSDLPTQEAIEGPALIFEDAVGLGAEVRARLRAAGRAVVTVRPERRFSARRDDIYTIRPGEAADYERLLNQLAAAGKLPAQVYHCWMVTGRGPIVRRHRLGELQELGFESLMLLAPALARQAGDARIEVAVVTDRLARISTEGDLIPEKATVLGPCRVMGTEHPDIRARHVDISLPDGRTADALRPIAEALIAELSASDGADAVALRAGERWVQRFARSRAPAACAPAMRPDGVYLITGGLGGIGLSIAKHIAATKGARIALLARTPLPPRADWPELVMERASGDPVADKVRHLLALEAAGAEVQVLHADVTDERALRLAVRVVRNRWGPVTGVFHTAGTLDDGLMDTKIPAAARAVLAPKLAGTLALEAALKDERPDFVMLFSSISAFAGLPGQADYAAANAFLDAYAQSRRAVPGARIVSVAWSQWRDVGMAAALARGATGPRPPAAIGPGATLDHPVLQNLHAISPDEYVATATLSPETHWLLDEHRIVGAGALIPGTGYLEIARATFAAVEQDPGVLSDVTFMSPFSVPDGAARELLVHLQRRGGDWRFAVLGRPAGLETDGWTEHATGLIRPAADEGAPGTFDLADLRVRCEAVPIAGAADQTPRLRFGPRWDVIGRRSQGMNEALLDLALPERFAADLDQVALHPALLDLATAGAQTLIRGFDPSRDFYAPLSYRRLRLHAPLPARIVSHVRYRAPITKTQPTAVFDVTIADESGTVLVEIAEFTMIRVRDAALLGAGGRQTSAARPAQPVASTPAQTDGILPEEGVRVIEHVLAGGAKAHLVVSPYELGPAMARLKAPCRAVTRAASDDPSGDDAPITATERTIAELWSDLLGVDAIRRTDDFFDLGGHSLLAVQFINRLRKRTGRTLPLAALLETPTVERLAALIDPEGAAVVAAPAGASAAAGHDLIVIREGGTATPLFLVHDGLGETLLYRSLALQLAPGRPIYGLEPDRDEAGGFAHTTIDEMASAYVDRIRRVSPHGPYMLAGLCAGGVIAFDMARRLRDAGDAVPFVGILDAADVAATRRKLYITKGRLRRVRALLGSFDLRTVPVLARKAANAAMWEVGSRLEQARRRRIVRRMQGTTTPPTDNLSFLQLYEVAHRAHQPRGVFSGGDVVLFKATEGTGAPEDIAYREVYSDCVLGWGKRVAEDVTVLSAPGGHGSMLQEPNVGRLARLFQEALDGALARYGDRRPAPLPTRTQPWADGLGEEADLAVPAE